MRESEPEKYVNLAYDTMAHHIKLMLELQKRGAITFDYGNNLRGQAKDKRGVMNAFNFPGFVLLIFDHCFVKEVVHSDSSP